MVQGLRDQVGDSLGYATILTPNSLNWDAAKFPRHAPGMALSDGGTVPKRRFVATHLAGAVSDVSHSD